MDNGKNNGSMVVKKNQVTELMNECKTQLETNLKNWLAKTPLVTVETVVDSVMEAVSHGVRSAAINLGMITIGSMICSAVPLLKPFKGTTGSRLMCAHEVGILSGVNAGIKCGMKKLQGKVDDQTIMVAGFGAGVILAIYRREPPAHVILAGVISAIFEVAFFKVSGERKSRGNEQE